jgi:hypothetical protein
MPGAGSLNVSRHRLLELPAIADRRGTLTFVEEGRPVPFEIRRVFYVYGVPEGQSRGAHARVGFDEVIVAVAGRFEVVLDYGSGELCTVTLDRPDSALFVPGSVWRELRRFSPGAVCLVLASERYLESPDATGAASSAERN